MIAEIALVALSLGLLVTLVWVIRSFAEERRQLLNRIASGSPMELAMMQRATATPKVKHAKVNDPSGRDMAPANPLGL